MTHEEMKQEKVAMQKALIYFEGLHGRPVSFCVYVCVYVRKGT